MVNKKGKRKKGAIVSIGASGLESDADWKQEHNSNEGDEDIDTRYHQINRQARSRHKYGKDPEGGEEGGSKKLWEWRQGQERPKILALNR